MVQYVDVVPTLIEAAGGDPAAIDAGRPDTTGNRGVDGRSFLSVLRGRADTFRDYVYGVQTTRGIIDGSECYPIRSVRSARYKYIRNLNHEAPFSNLLTSREDSVLHAWLAAGKDDPAALARAQFYSHRPAEEIYDLQAGPFELKNRADDPALAEIKKDLAHRLDLWMEQQGDRGIETEMQAQKRKGAFLRKARRGE
jgi:uncharacterized sulfatase